MFSIIIPVYNASQTIARCVESVVAQSFCEWELILVDDGSSDDSWDIIQQFANGDRRIKALHQVNSGPSAARNNGIDIATKEWMLFIDADDYIEKDYLEKYKDAIADSDCLVVGRATEHDHEKTYKTQPMERFSSPCAHCYNTDIIKQYNIQFPEELTCGEDAVFNLRYCNHVSKLIDLAYFGYHRIVYTSSLSHRNDINALMASINALEKARQDMDYINESTFYSDFVQSRINIRCSDIINQMYTTGKYGERAWLLKQLFPDRQTTQQRFSPTYKSEKLALKALIKRHYHIADTLFLLGIRCRGLRNARRQAHSC